MWGAGCCSSELCGKPWTTSCHSAEQLTAHLAQLGQPVALLPKYLRVQQPLQEGLGPTEVLTPWKLKACGSVMMRQSKTRSKGWQKEGIARTIPASCPIHYLPEEMEMCSYHMVGTGGLRWGRGRGEVFEHKEGRQSALAKLLLVFCSVSVNTGMTSSFMLIDNRSNSGTICWDRNACNSHCKLVTRKPTALKHGF